MVALWLVSVGGRNQREVGAGSVLSPSSFRWLRWLVSVGGRNQRGVGGEMVLYYSSVQRNKERIL